MEHPARKITQIAREAEHIVLLAMRQDEIGTAEIDCIHALRHHPGITQTELAGMLHADKPAIARRTASLERKGYLTRSRDALDRRVVRICPTDKGLSANADHALFHRRMTDQVLNLLSEEETVVFMRALDRLTQFFRQECGAHAGTCQNHLQNKEKTS